MTTIRSFDGVRQAEIFITTNLVIFNEWLKREINQQIKFRRKRSSIKTEEEYCKNTLIISHVSQHDIFVQHKQMKWTTGLKNCPV